MGTRNRLLTAAAVLAFLLLPLLQFPDMFFGGQLPGSEDPLRLELPARVYFADMLRAGLLAFLYPDNAQGTPLFANPVAGAFYPVTLLHLVVTPANAVRLSWLLHALILCTGWRRALLRLGHSEAASVVTPAFLLCSGVVFSFHKVAFGDFQSMAWTGWIVAFLVESITSGDRSAAVLAGGCCALTVTGADPLSGAVSVVVALAMVRRVPAPRQAALFAVMAALVALPVVIEGARFVPLSERASPFTRFEAMSYALDPFRLVELVSPALFHALRPGGARHVGYSGAVWYPSIALGIVASACVVSGAVRGKGRERVLLVGAAVLAWLAMGPFAPGAEWAWEHVPPLTHMRSPERLLKHALILLAPVIACGVDVVSSRIALRAVIIGVLGVGELLLVMPPPKLAPESALAPSPPFEQLQRPARVAVCNLAGEAAVGRLDVDTRPWGIAMLLRPDSSASAFLKYVPCELMRGHRSLQWLGVSHVVMAVTPRFPDVAKTFGITGGWPLPGTPFSLVSVADSGPWIATFTPRFEVRPFIREVKRDHHGAPFVDVNSELDALEAGTFFVHPSHALDEKGRLTAPSALPAMGACDAQPFAIPVELGPTQEAIWLNARMPCAGLVSLPWRFLAGWRATLNGAPVEILEVNDQTLGVMVPAGDVKLEVVYEPWGLGWMILAGLAGWCVMAWLAVRRMVR